MSGQRTERSYLGMQDIAALQVVKAPAGALPIPPSPGEEARRIVRHGFAAAYSDFEHWDGPVGPEPGEQIRIIRLPRHLLVDDEVWRLIRLQRPLPLEVSRTLVDMAAERRRRHHPWRLP